MYSEPTDPYLRRMLGAGNYRLGEFEQAVNNLTRSAELMLAKKGRTDRTGWAFIAMAQFKLGRLDEARQALAKMHASEPDPDDSPHPEVEAEAISLIEPATTPPPSKLASSAPSKTAPATAPSVR